MKMIIRYLACFLVALTLCACSLSTSDLENEVKDLVNQKLSGTGIKATNVLLTHVEGNDYSGIVTLTDGSDAEEFDINVVYDGRSFQYEIPAFNDEY